MKYCLNGENLNADKKFFSKIGTNYLIYAICTIILQILAVNILRLTSAGLLSDINTLAIISAICNYVLPLPILVFLMNKLESDRLEMQSLNIKTLVKYIAVSMTLMWIGNIIGTLITTLISFSTPMDVTNPVHKLINSTGIWINIIVISLIGPAFEELFFRKLLIDRTIKYGAKISILLSALMFGLFHGNLSQFFYAFLMGGFFAYVYIKTGKLKYPILLHMSVNFMGSVVSLFVVTSVENLTAGQFIATDLIITIGYVLIILACLLIGFITLLRYKPGSLNHIKTRIPLAQPLQTVILNYGMVLFIGFCIFEIIYQIAG